MEAIGELEVKEYDHVKRVMHLAKDLLLSQERLNLIAGTNSSPTATKAAENLYYRDAQVAILTYDITNSAPVATVSAENLVRFGYVTIENIQTLTEVKNDRRFIKLIITIKKTSDFKKIYDANKEEVKKKQEERQAKEKTTEGK